MSKKPKKMNFIKLGKLLKKSEDQVCFCQDHDILPKYYYICETCGKTVNKVLFLEYVTIKNV